MWDLLYKTSCSIIYFFFHPEPEIPDIEEEEEPTEQTEGEQKEAEEGEPLGEQPLTVSSPTEEEETSRKGTITISFIFCNKNLLIFFNYQKTMVVSSFFILLFS